MVILLEISNFGHLNFSGPVRVIEGPPPREKVTQPGGFTISIDAHHNHTSAAERDRVLGAIDVDKSISDCRNFSRNRLGITPDAAVECSD